MRPTKLMRPRNLMRPGNDDRGVALPIVLVLGFVMVMLVATSLTAVRTGLDVSDRTQDTTGAVDAAYAGVQEYAARLSSDSGYQAFGNPQSTFTSASGSTVTLPTTANPAFAITAGGTWASVPGSSGTATYRYEVDNSDYATTGVVNLRSTGRVGSTTRSIVAAITQTGFIDYVYFTDLEVQDPLISGYTNCAKYAWLTPTRTPPAGSGLSTCDIAFAPSDRLTGPVHSNDTISVCGATFTGAVTSSTPTPPYSTVLSPSCAPTTYGVGSGVTFSPLLTMPASNASMATVAATSGCLYTGPTQITYNSSGTMTVKSPWTKQTEPLASATTPAKCGTLTALRSTAGATVATLNNSLLYVQGVPIATADPNYSATTTAGLPTGFTCLDSSGSFPATGSASSAGWRFGTVQYPRFGESPADGWDNGSSWDTTSPAYGCRAGDLYVSGTVKGVTTAASANYIYVVNDLQEASQSNDLLGLVGNSAVLVWNPISTNFFGVTTNLLTDSGREIDAAILSVQHTFQVQNFRKGSTRGTLTVFGSIAQKYRGPVAAGNATGITSGYAKDYQYDPRLTSVVPPYFMAPASSLFSVSRYAQVAAAFASTGAAQ